MREFLGKDHVEKCFESKEVKSFINEVVENLGIQRYERNLFCEEFARDSTGYVEDNVNGRFLLEDHKIILYTESIKNTAEQFTESYWSIDKKKKALQAVLCFTIAHELVHAWQYEEGRECELKKSARAQKKGVYDTPIEKEANEKAYELISGYQFENDKKGYIQGIAYYFKKYIDLKGQKKVEVQKSISQKLSE